MPAPYSLVQNKHDKAWYKFADISSQHSVKLYTLYNSKGRAPSGINYIFYLANKLISFCCPQGADAADEAEAGAAVATNSGGPPAAAVTTEEEAGAAAGTTEEEAGAAAASATNPEPTKDGQDERECVLDIGCSRCPR